MRHNTKRSLLLLPVLLTVLTSGSWAQNSINGIVFDDERRAVAKIDIELQDEFERLIKTTKTAGSGLYFFQGLRPGTYYVQVRVDGTNYQTAKERIQLGQGNRTSRTTGLTSGAESLQVNFTLHSARMGSSPGPRLNNSVVFAQNVPAAAQEFYKSAIRKLGEKKQSEAVRELEEAVRIFPEYFLALDKLGFEYLSIGRYVDAESIFERELRVNAKSFSGRSGLGIAQYKLNKKAESARTLEEAVVLDPSSVNTLLFLGKVYRDLKRFTEAESKLRRANELADKKAADVHWELALLYYYDMVRPRDAADELELYLKADPQASNRELVEKLIRKLRSGSTKEK